MFPYFYVNKYRYLRMVFQPNVHWQSAGVNEAVNFCLPYCVADQMSPCHQNISTGIKKFSIKYKSKLCSKLCFGCNTVMSVSVCKMSSLLKSPCQKLHLSLSRLPYALLFTLPLGLSPSTRQLRSAVHWRRRSQLNPTYSAIAKFVPMTFYLTCSNMQLQAGMQQVVSPCHLTYT